MKPDKSYKRPARRQGEIQIPSWVIFCLIILATFAVCVTVTMRAHKEVGDAMGRYQRIKEEIDSQHENNASLAAAVRQLRAGGTITIIELQPNTNSEASINPTTPDQQAPSSLDLLLYCLAALASGFASVRSLIALLRAKVRGRHNPRDIRNETQVDYTINYERGTRATRQVLLLAGCLALAAGFIYAARQQILAVEYGYKTEALRRERDQLLDEQRRLLLAVEESSSLAQLGRVVRESGMRPSAESGSSTINDTALSYNSVHSDSFSLPLTKFGSSSTSVPWTTLILLILFGGAIAVMSSGLLSQILPSSLIGRAPGTTFHSVVDFLYSPKTVRETFEPIIADWRVEYFEALSQKKVWKTRWICVRYTYSFIMAMGLSKIFSFYKVFTRAGK
jgi:hypothetical protein